jgi:hypothetical protein
MSSLKIVDRVITIDEFLTLAKEGFGDFVKAVVDIERGVMAVGGELHSDEEQVLLEQGSKQSDLWGGNIYPEKSRDQWIEFDSMINIRPAQGNRSRSVENQAVRVRIVEIINRLVT